MKQFCSVVLSIIFSVLVIPYVHATFSIVAVDPETGEVGGAGATCIRGLNFGDKVAYIVPGVGVVHTQARFANNTKKLAMQRLIAQDSPQQIIDYLKQNDRGYPLRQNLAAGFDDQRQPMAAAFTGTRTKTYAGHIIGPNYAIAGNILSGPHIIENMEDAFVNTEGPLAAKLMAALQAAKAIKADSRCRRTSSYSGYLGVAKPDDLLGEPYFYYQAKPRGYTDPIDEIQAYYDANFKPVTQPNKPSLQVSAGEDVTVTLGNTETISLSGTVSGHGFIAQPLVVFWSKISGPGDVAFGSTNELNTDVRFFLPGDYVLQLWVSQGELTQIDTLRVTVEDKQRPKPDYNLEFHIDYNVLAFINPVGAQHKSLTSAVCEGVRPEGLNVWYCAQAEIGETIMILILGDVSTLHITGCTLDPTTNFCSVSAAEGLSFVSIMQPK